jgi:hypothetical protein
VTDAYAAPLDAVARILDRGGDADDVLRAVVDLVHAATGAWAGIAFLEEGRLVPGPEAGSAAGGERAVYPIRFADAPVAELWVAGEPDDEQTRFLERVAVAVSPYCLVGWDTGGERWEP